jgi:hypothetical protein
MHLSIQVNVNVEPVHVRKRAAFEESPDVAVAIGEAPDGLPLILQVARDRDVTSPILRVLGEPAGAIRGDVSSAIETLQRLVTKQTLRAGLTQKKGGYTSSRSVGDMLGASLLANTLGAVGPLVDRSTTLFEAMSDDRVSATCAGVVMSKHEIETMIGSANASRRLFVPVVAEGRCKVVTLGDADKDVREERSIIFERLERIPGARYAHCTRYDSRWTTANFEEKTHRPYREMVKTSDHLVWMIPKRAIAEALATMAFALEAEMHSVGRVHGDIKPANMLLGENGPVLIDPLNIEVGRVATVCTPSWAAPEQVTARPVSAATDVFAFGLVLARLIDAVVFGEERTFVVPTGGSSTRRMKILHDPQVFIDPTAGLAFSEKSMKAYAAFITRCTAFDASSRPKNGNAFAGELRELLERHPLPLDHDKGWAHLGWLSGALHRTVDLLGSTQPAWVISDARLFS